MISKRYSFINKIKKKALLITIITSIITLILIPSIVIPEITNGWIYIKDIIFGNVSEPRLISLNGLLYQKM